MFFSFLIMTAHTNQILVLHFCIFSLNVLVHFKQSVPFYPFRVLFFSLSLICTPPLLASQWQEIGGSFIFFFTSRLKLGVCRFSFLSLKKSLACSPYISLTCGTQTSRHTHRESQLRAGQLHNTWFYHIRLSMSPLDSSSPAVKLSGRLNKMSEWWLICDLVAVCGSRTHTQKYPQIHSHTDSYVSFQWVSYNHTTQCTPIVLHDL